MEGLWKLSGDSEGIESFVRNFGYELEAELKIRKAYGDPIELGQSELDCHSGFMLYWRYANNFWGEIMVTESKNENNTLIIDRFWGIRTNSKTSSPNEHRKAAQIYEDITSFIDLRFGKPIAEHDGRSIYEVSLGKVVFPAMK